ncbi:hypothetical protein ACET3Z_020613 [Daucus carota]
MSLVVSVASCFDRSMGFEEEKAEKSGDEREGNVKRDDESLRRWKEQLLGAVDVNNVGESAEPEVKIISLSILSPGRPAIVLPIPEDGKPKGLWFTLKEGSSYSLRFTFQVSNNIVVGFRYTNNVWKTGFKVDSEKLMLGTFSPQPKPYTIDVPEETTPSGYFARGQYSAISKLLEAVRLSKIPIISSLMHFVVSLCRNLRILSMEKTVMFIVCSTLVLLCSTSAYAQKGKSPPSPPISMTPTPAPAPAPEHVNLTELLSVAGPFHTFLDYLVSTKVIETLQNQANDTEEGLTLFVPKDKAFSSLKTPSLSNLTAAQLKSLCLFHALPHYYSLADFKNLSQASPIMTFAGGAYTLNFTDNSGSILVGSGWTNTKVSSSVHSTDPVAVYQVDKVLLPEAIFGTDIPPMPAPAPAPEVDSAAPADAPDADSKHASSESSSTPSSSYRIISFSTWSFLVLAFSSGMALLL